MYPLKNWAKLPNGYKFGQKTFYNNAHVGTDKICPQGTPVYAHENGTAKRGRTAVQGNFVHIIDTRGHLVRYMHLQKPGFSGAVKKGQIIGYTGNTGLSTAPHLHVDVSKGKIYVPAFANFINPEDYFIQKPAAKKYGVTTRNCNVRSAATTKSVITKVLKKGTKVQILGAVKGQRYLLNNKWYRVSGGFVWSGNIKEIR